MPQQDTQFVARIAVKPETLAKARILWRVRFGGFDHIGELAGFLYDDAWQEALNAGVVKESMLKEEKNKKAVAG